MIWADEPEDRLVPTESACKRWDLRQPGSERPHARAQFEQMRSSPTTIRSTQLPNRRAFMRELERTVGEAIETRQPLSLVVLDLDDLKALNDRHGHANGDDCLVRIGRLLKTELRPGIRPSGSAATSSRCCWRGPTKRRPRGWPDAFPRRWSAAGARRCSESKPARHRGATPGNRDPGRASSGGRRGDVPRQEPAQAGPHGLLGLGARNAFARLRCFRRARSLRPGRRLAGQDRPPLGDQLSARHRRGSPRTPVRSIQARSFRFSAAGSRVAAFHSCSKSSASASSCSATRSRRLSISLLSVVWGPMPRNMFAQPASGRVRLSHESNTFT